MVSTYIGIIGIYRTIGKPPIYVIHLESSQLCCVIWIYLDLWVGPGTINLYDSFVVSIIHLDSSGLIGRAKTIDSSDLLGFIAFIGDHLNL